VTEHPCHLLAVSDVPPLFCGYPIDAAFSGLTGNSVSWHGVSELSTSGKMRRGQGSHNGATMTQIFETSKDTDETLTAYTANS